MSVDASGTQIDTSDVLTIEIYSKEEKGRNQAASDH